MNSETVLMLFDYNWALHRRVWDECILPLTEEQFTRDLPYSIGSIHRQVVHVMSAEWLWLSRLQGNSPKAMFNIEDYPTRAHIRVRWDEIEADFRTYLGELDDLRLAEPRTYYTLKGQPQQEQALPVLLHVVNHGTDHRAQILAMIHKMGGSTLEQDLIFYRRAQVF